MSDTNHFSNDTLETVYNELWELEPVIEATGRNIKQLAVDAANARAVYENFKNQALIEMYAEEAKGNFKRTVDQRASVYRAMYSAQRLAANLAENAWKAEQDYMKGLQSRLTSVQTRVRIIETDMRMNYQP